MTTAAPETSPVTSGHVDQYCTFWAGGLYFGVAVCDVQEVLRGQEMTAVPRAPAAVRGLINLRGHIVAAVDLRCRLGLPERPTGEAPMNVIVRSRGEAAGLLVDEIGDVIDVDRAAVEPVPGTVPSSVRDTLTGVVALPDSILLVLDANRVADVSVATRLTGGNP